MTLEVPDSFPFSRLAPTQGELEYMCEFLVNHFEGADPINVLEFGSGVSTWAIYNGVTNYMNNREKCTNYIAVEDWEQNVIDTKKNLPMVNIIDSSWEDIPKNQYSVVFVDSSACRPGPPARGLYRHEATEYAESLMAENALVIIHDWHHRSGKGPRRYLEGRGYNLVGSFKGRTGVGIYQL
jgi:hypothetical protein